MEHKKVFSQAGLSLFVMILVINIVQMIMSVAGYIVFPEAVNSTNFLLLQVFVSTDIVGFGVFYLMMRKPQTERVKLEKKKMSVRDFIVVFLICMAGTYVFNMISSLINYGIGLLTNSTIINPLDSAIGGNMILQIIVLCIGAPVVEELIFRKLLLDHLRPYGDKTAIWVTALTFALMHGNLSQALYALFLGMVFAYIVLRTNDVRYSIALHLIINLLGSVVLPMMVAGGSVVLTAIAGLLVIAFMLSGIILFVLNIKRIVLEEGEITLEKSGRFRTIYLNAGMLLYIIVCLATFALVIISSMLQSMSGM